MIKENKRRQCCEHHLRYSSAGIATADRDLHKISNTDKNFKLYVLELIVGKCSDVCVWGKTSQIYLKTIHACYQRTVYSLLLCNETLRLQ